MPKMTPTGPDTARDSKGWEYKRDGSGLTDTSATIRREQASEIQRETRGTISRTQALDASTKMGNPAKYDRSSYNYDNSPVNKKGDRYGGK